MPRRTFARPVRFELVKTKEGKLKLFKLVCCVGSIMQNYVVSDSKGTCSFVAARGLFRMRLLSMHMDETEEKL